MAEHWIQDARLKRGAFTAKAKKAGKSVQAYAAAKANSPGVLGKQARLARTFAKIRRHNPTMLHMRHA